MMNVMIHIDGNMDSKGVFNNIRVFDEGAKWFTTVYFAVRGLGAAFLIIKTSLSLAALIKIKGVEGVNEHKNYE